MNDMDGREMFFVYHDGRASLEDSDTCLVKIKHRGRQEDSEDGK